MITREQFDAAIQAKKDADEIINTYCRQQNDEGNERWSQYLKGKGYTDEELVYASRTLCPCGYGLAYPKNCGDQRSWDCSAVLKLTHDKTVKHTDRLPFAFWSVHAEGETIGNKNTTRGVFRPKPSA